jgi:propionyl-CoA synthetase
MGRYQQEYHQSLTEPDQYWGGAAKLIDWYTEPTVVLDRSDPPFYRWFAGGVLNTCFNAVDRHVRDGRAGQPALIYDSPVTGSQRVMTYRELLEEVARFAGVLTGRGVRAGERVVIYMPMVPEAVVAMLACARIGAVHSVVFGGFAAAELATRIEDARPVAIVTASTSPGTAATSTRTGTCSSWAGPTMSSTWRATGCPPARWRRCWPAIPRWPSAP